MDVTVIIPTRNRLWSLPKAVNSCRTHSISTEIIVVDDGSTDGTAEWLASQPDLIVMQGEGWGKPAAVNAAQRRASGRYIRFLDSDDWLNDEQNAIQFDVAVNSDADVILSGVDVYEDELFDRRIEYILPEDFVCQQLSDVYASHYSSFLFRSEFVFDIPHRTQFAAVDFASRDDRCFMLEVALKGPRLSVSPTPALCHRHHSRGRLQEVVRLKSTGTHIQQLYIYKQILRLLDRRGELTLSRRRAAIKSLWPLAHWIAYADLSEAERLVEYIYELDSEFVPSDEGLLGLFYRRLGFGFTERVLFARRLLLALFNVTGFGVVKR